MKNLVNFHDSIDEIVFTGRNKSYGAYALRKEYDQNMVKGMLLGPLVLALVFLILGLRQAPVEVKEISIPIVLPDYVFDVAQIKKAVLPPPQRPGKAASVAPALTTKVIDDNTPIVKNVDNTPVVNVTNTTPNNGNTNTGTATGNNESKGEGGGEGGGSAIDNTPTKNDGGDVRIFAEVMPSFPDGYEALAKFLTSKLNYPAFARENNIQGAVILQFVVMEDGSISQIKVLRGIGGGCDEEAKRVVGLMPKWKPGMFNSKPVKVRFTLPVKFQLK